MQFADEEYQRKILHTIDYMTDCTYLPHNAEYFTFIIMSVSSIILGIGRSSISTFRVPLNTTAFIVDFVILRI